jgi:threonine dehydrogenase-like Zn-dependent dehydrogenase
MSMGQTHMHKFLKPLLEHVAQGHIDPSFLISHRIGIDQAPEMYSKWQKKEDGVTKIVIAPWRDTIDAETNARVA